MLQRIITIKNVGRFQSSAAAGDVTFRRFTLIFAENGRGKTTLCAILRSLATNAPALIIGRKTLGSLGQPEVQLLVGGDNLAFRGGVWNAPFPDIGIFDGVFVSENVFAGDVVDTDNRRNLFRIIIGAPGVALAARLNEIDGLIRTKTTEIRENRARIQRHVAPGMSVEVFLGLAQDPAIDAKIAEKEREVSAVRRAASIQQRGLLAPLPVPAFPTQFAALLAKTVANLAADVAQRMSEHIVRHGMQAQGEVWLSEGLRYIAGESCPFCGQRVAGLDLVRIYEDFFSAKYRALRTEVTDLGRQVEDALGDRISGSIAQTLVRNDAAVDFWREYCALVPPVLEEAGRVAPVLAGLRTTAQALIQQKAATPLEAVAPTDDFTRRLSEFEALRASIAEYNARVAGANAIIEARKRETQAANLREVEGALARLKSQNARHSDGVRELCLNEEQLQAVKRTLETEKEQKRQELDAHIERVIALYGQSINRYLERINAGFRISTPTHTYRGGTPNTSYQILINQNAVDLGDAATPADRPSFRNTLSAGDRSTLALAFFLAQLEQDGERARKVIVFDDPFSSLDSFRRSHTVNQIRRCGDACAQVILLSHEATFLKLLWDQVAPGDRKALQLARVGEENTTIAEWDVEKAVQWRYRLDIEALQRYFSLGEGERRDVIQKLRPVLEGYCRNLYPTQFGERDTLGEIVVKIRAAGAAHPLQAIADDLDEVNIYCRRYHHAENPNAATEPIDDGELQGYVKRTLGLVGCLL